MKLHCFLELLIVRLDVKVKVDVYTLSKFAVHFDQLSGTRRSWSKHFFSPVFNLFCSFQTLVSDFMPEIKKKRLKMNKKHIFFI